MKIYIFFVTSDNRYRLYGNYTMLRRLYDSVDTAIPCGKHIRGKAQCRHKNGLYGCRHKQTCPIVAYFFTFVNIIYPSLPKKDCGTA